MSSINIISSVRGLFPGLAAAAEQYRQAKPDRESRNIVRHLANEEVLFDQFTHKLSLLSSLTPMDDGEDVLRNVKDKLGHETVDRLRVDLLQMEEFLRALKAELANTSRGTEVLVKLRRKTTISSRGNIPRTPLQKRLEEFSKVNKRLASYLVEEQISVPLVRDFHTTLDFRILFYQHPYVPPEALRITGARYSCACQEVISESIVYSDYQSPSLGGGTPLGAQDLEENDKFLQERSKHISISVCSRKGSGDDTSFISDIYPGVDGIEEQGHDAPQGFVKQDKDRTVFRLQVKDTKLPPVTISLEDLITRGIADFDRRKRMELAFRLSSAVLLIWTSSRMRGFLKWRDWTVSFAPQQEDNISSIFLSPKSRRDEKPGEVQSPSKTALSILAREPVLTLLGLRLVELAFGQTLAEIRQRDASLVYENEEDQELLDLLTVKRLLGRHRIEDEFGRGYEGVVNACLNQQYREPKGAHIKSFNLENASVLESVTVAILLPLFQEVRKSFGCDCDRAPRADAKYEGPQGIDDVEYEEKPLAPSVPKPLGAGIVQLSDMVANEESFQLLTAPRLAESISSLSADDASEKIQDRMRDVNLDSSCEEPVDPDQPSVLETSTAAVEEESEIVGEDVTQSEAAPTRSASEAEVSWRETKVRNGASERGTSAQQLHSQSHDVYAASDYSYETMTATTDSAFAWISENTEDPPYIPDNHPLMLFEDVSLRILWRGYQAWRERGYGASEASGSIHRPEPPKKRSRMQQEKDECDEDEQDGERDTSARNPRVSNKKRKVHEVTFSCPFFKKDAMVHKSCCKYVLTRIRDVKQHLARCHQMPIYCPCCIRTFDDENSRDSHVRDMICERRPYGTLEGITEAQRKQLARKAPANQTPEEQWYGIFDILFPDHNPRPESPYMDSDLLQNVIGYQSFLVSHGPRILGDILTARGAVTWNLPHGESDLQAFRHRILEDGFRIIFEQWTGRGVSARLQPNNTNATTGTLNETGQPTTPGPSTTAASSYGDESRPNLTPASASSYVASDLSWSWDGDGEWLANLHLNNAEDSGLNPITAADTEEINQIFMTDVGLLNNHITYP